MPLSADQRRDIRRSLRSSALFREVNERVREVGNAWGVPSEPIGFLCECGDAKCIGVLSVTLAEYEAIRAAPERFLVLRGHELPDSDQVVDGVNGYLIVERRASVAG
jgi:hypothetical protein